MKLLIGIAIVLKTCVTYPVHLAQSAWEETRCHFDGCERKANRK